MMRQYVTFFLFLLFYINGLAQVSHTPKNELEEPKQKCSQYEAMQWMQEHNPDDYQIYQESKEILQQEAVAPQAKNGTIYTIPVVFHILHNNGPENISDEQVQDALYILNRDFRKQNTDVNNVVAQFLPIAGDVEVEFEFATIAPDGTCFDGITRTVTTETSNSEQYGGLAQVNAVIAGNDVYQGIWPHHKYLNIFICKNVVEGAAGYTYPPYGDITPSASNMRYNGIFVVHDCTGSIGTSSNYTSRVITHETGHWLNLSHIWGSVPIGTCGDDLVADTPQTTGAYSCITTQTTCDGNLDNVENYMDYAYCSKMFTNGQAARMRSAVVSSVAGRSNMWKQANLEEVGVIPGGNSACAIIEASDLTLCEGNTTTFSIDLGDEEVYAYAWSFPGGSPATSTASNPEITYNLQGEYDVSLTINSASGTNTYTKENFIEVIEAPTVLPLPLEEGFVVSNFPSTGWTIDNGGEPTTWHRALVGNSPTAGNSAKISFDPGTNTITTGDIDDLNTPYFSLLAATEAILTFDVAYREWSSTYSDQLQVLISTGCGTSFEIVYDKAGNTLATENAGYGYEYPNIWRKDTVDLTPYVGNDVVSVKFRAISGYGNALYLDNINITQLEGQSDTAPVPGMSINNNQICVGETVSITDESIGNPTSWNWSFPGGTPLTSTLQNPTVTYNTTGNYDITLEVANSYGNESTTFVNEVTVNALPSTPNIMQEGSILSINLENGEAATWFFEDIQIGEGESIVITETGTYKVVVTNAFGCSSTATGEYAHSTGIHQETIQGVDIFPNPTTGYVEVYSTQTIKKIVVLDNLGRIIKKVDVNNGTHVKLNLERLAAGSYHLQSHIGGRVVICKLIIK